MLESLGEGVREVRARPDLAGISGLVIPGGESTVMDKLTRIFGLHEPLKRLIAEGLPVLGTCAGMIMLANDLEDGISGQKTLGGLDVTVVRNAFGRKKTPLTFRSPSTVSRGGPSTCPSSERPLSPGWGKVSES
jgi:5'-phosphate synthase pdxT subunit